jgi:hypothetical protein
MRSMGFKRVCHFWPNVIMPLFVFLEFIFMDEHDTRFSFQADHLFLFR